MTNENDPRSAIEEARAILRHPSMFGDAPERLYREAIEKRDGQRLRTLVAQLHDFFRYGDPAATPALELYLHENETGLHAESVLDELEALVLSGGGQPPIDTPGAAA
jgi:hypothetical protein